MRRILRYAFDPAVDEAQIGKEVVQLETPPVAAGVSGFTLHYTYECPDDDRLYELEYLLDDQDMNEEYEGEFRLQNDCPPGCPPVSAVPAVSLPYGSGTHPPGNGQTSDQDVAGERGGHQRADR